MKAKTAVGFLNSPRHQRHRKPHLAVSQEIYWEKSTYSCKFIPCKDGKP